MPPATLIEDCSNDRYQLSVFSIHKFPLILGWEKEPHVDPISSSVHNLQKLITTNIVKNNIIATIPHCSNHRTGSYTNPFFHFFINTTEPLPNNFFMLVGGGILKEKCTTCQTNLANMQQ
jgi:hypothetical protein